MKTLKTKSGTELPLVNLKGKDYLQVMHRLVWFREEHPDWSIETELLSSTDQSAVSKATIRDTSGRVIATSHKEESSKDFAAGHREKAETGSIGRALALCGYGTQFEPELDEGDRIVDSPVTSKTSAPMTASNNVVGLPVGVPLVANSPAIVAETQKTSTRTSAFKRITKPTPTTTPAAEESELI